jgi:hypothetical protein
LKTEMGIIEIVHVAIAIGVAVEAEKLVGGLVAEDPIAAGLPVPVAVEGRVRVDAPNLVAVDRELICPAWRTTHEKTNGSVSGPSG